MLKRGTVVATEIFGRGTDIDSEIRELHCYNNYRPQTRYEFICREFGYVLSLEEFNPACAIGYPNR